MDGTALVELRVYRQEYLRMTAVADPSNPELLNTVRTNNNRLLKQVRCTSLIDVGNMYNAWVQFSLYCGASWPHALRKSRLLFDCRLYQFEMKRPQRGQWLLDTIHQCNGNLQLAGHEICRKCFGLVHGFSVSVVVEIVLVFVVIVCLRLVYLFLLFCTDIFNFKLFSQMRVL